MNIKNILDDNIDDMIAFFRNNKIKYRKYSLEKCYIMKINSDNIKEEWQRNLRGLVYNYFISQRKLGISFPIDIELPNLHQKCFFDQIVKN